MWKQCDIISHLSEWLSSNSQQIINIGENMYLMEQLYTIGRNEAVAVIIENSKEVLPKLKNRIITWSSNSTPEYITGKKMKMLIWKYTGISMLRATLITIAKIWKQSSVLQHING